MLLTAPEHTGVGSWEDLGGLSGQGRWGCFQGFKVKVVWRRKESFRQGCSSKPFVPVLGFVNLFMGGHSVTASATGAARP